MISTTKEPLPEAKAHALRAWLQKTEFQTLQTVIASKGKEHSAAVVNTAIESQTHELKLAESNDELRKAQRYATALDVLKEIADQKSPFEIVKLT